MSGLNPHSMNPTERVEHLNRDIQGRTFKGVFRSFLHLGTESPEKRRDRFFERSTEAIRKLKESLQSEKPLMIVDANIKNIEGSFSRHLDNLAQPTSDYDEQRRTYSAAINLATESQLTLRPRKLSEADKNERSRILQLASQYVTALEDRLNSSRSGDGN